jgi:3-dehydroquinate dehydratase-2
MNLLIINGPNLDLLGVKREISGNLSFDEYLEKLRKRYPDHEIDSFQTNVEGEILNKIREVEGRYDGLILSPSSYAHYSIALSDTIATVDTPVVEVHINNIYKQDQYHQRSVTATHCEGIISGFGYEAYRLAVEYFIER